MSFLERVGWPFFTAMRPLAGPMGASIFLVWGVSVRISARLLIKGQWPANQDPRVPADLLQAGAVMFLRRQRRRKSRGFALAF